MTDYTPYVYDHDELKNATLVYCCPLIAHGSRPFTLQLSFGKLPKPLDWLYDLHKF